MKSRALLVCVLLLAAERDVIPGRHALEVLRRTDRLESSQLGYSGTTSRLGTAYRELLREQNAAAFLELFRTGTPAARVYALAGLYDTDRASFSRLIGSAFKKEQPWIFMIEGCVPRAVTTAEARARLESGALSASWGRPLTSTSSLQY